MNLINIFNAPIYEFETIDSTNKFSKDLCKDNPQNGTIVISNEQTQGRGRLGNSWESSKNKGLYFSIIFKCDTPNLKYELLTLFVCLGITDLLKDYSIHSKIKWPNDILINGKKVCGILSEMVSNSYGSFVVVGIGINLYQTLSDFPPELQEKATSLSLNTEDVIIKNFFVNSLISYLFKYYNYFLEDDFEKFLPKYINKSSIINREITIKLNGVDTSGVVCGFNELGHLLLKKDNEVISINSGEVSLTHTYKK